MGCDGYLHNIYDKSELILTCYTCGKEINLNKPINGHENCTFEWNGKDVLKIQIESEIEFR